MPVKVLDTVTVHYRGTVGKDEVFDDSRKRDEPLVFQLGAGQIIEGFEQAVLGMEKGESKTVVLKAEKAYGNRNPAAQKTVPRTEFPEGIEPMLGGFVGVSMGDGSQIPARIAAITPDEITLDLNHPLSGQTLTFEIEVVDVQSPA